MAIDVDQALRTLRLPPAVSYNSLAENVKAELRRRVALNCGPNLQPVTCPVCLSSSFIKFRYFNNRNALGKLPARFQCSNPQTCRDIEFTLHPGLGPPVIAQRCLPMVAVARSSIQSVKGPSTERPDLTARVAVPGKGTVQVGNKRTGTGKTKNVISSSRPSAALRDGASMSCVKGNGMSATDSSNVTCGRLEERRRSELSDQVFDRVSSHPGQRNQISTQRFAQNKGTGTTRSTDPKRKLQDEIGRNSSASKAARIEKSNADANADVLTVRKSLNSNSRDNTVKKIMIRIPMKPASQNLASAHSTGTENLLHDRDGASSTSSDSDSLSSDSTCSCSSSCSFCYTDDSEASIQKE